MPTLVLVRHAKAQPLAADDRSRRLVEAGRAQCGELRAWLDEQGLVPDRVLVSVALRAQETWELARVGRGEVVVVEELYQAGPDEVRGLVAATPSEVGVLAVVGHNPALEDLAWQLDDGEAAREVADRGLGTAGARAFALRAWDADEGRLTAWR